MINVNETMADMARMSDAQLKQTAVMNKTDPYLMSLLSGENARRQAIRQSAQAGEQNQPTVVDQELAQMDMQAQAPQGQAQAMPEDSGIAQLPTPNMETMSAAEGGIVGYADGGMVAFGDGGDVQHFQSGGSAFERWLNSNITPAEQKRRAALQAQAEAGRLVPAPATAMEQAERNREIVANQDFTRGDVRFPAGLTFDAPPVPKVEIPPVAAPGAAPRVSAASAAPRAPVVPDKDFMTRQKETEALYGPAVDPLEARRKTMTAEEKAGAEEGLAKLKADQESEMKEMFKGREARIGKREGELEKSKDTNTGMAFLEAGLAMMQARGPGLAGIAQGAGVGLKQYQSGIKDIKSAQEKLDDARDRMEELRQNQSSMNKSAVRAEEKGIQAIVNQGQRDLLAGAEKATGTKEANVRAAVTSDMAVSEAAKTRGTTLEAARIAAGPGLERNKMLAASQSDQAKLRKDFGTLQTKVMSELGKDPAYTLEQDPIKKTALYNNALRAALQNNPFLSSYAAGIGFNSAPASSTVRTLDED